MKEAKFQELKILHVGSPVFVGGKSFGETLHVEKHPGLRLQYDYAKREALVTWNGEVAEVPMFIYKIPGANRWLEERARAEEAKKKGAELDKVFEQPAPVVAQKVTAQVGGPTHHVFQGPGHGLTGQEPK